MKKYIIILIISTIIFSLISCSNNNESKKNAVTESSLEKNTIKSDCLIKTSSQPNDVDNNSSSYCTIHNFGYHSYPDLIIEYIGQDNFEEWRYYAHSEKDDNGCWPNGNIYNCIEYFNVPDNIVIESYQNDFYNMDWDIKALLERNPEAFELYSRNATDNSWDEKLTNELILKIDLFDVMKNKKDPKTIEYFNRVTNNGSHYPVCEVTIADMISNTSISKEDFEYAVGLASSYDGETYVQPHFEYNIDLLFNNNSLLVNTINTLDPEPYESRVKLADSLLHVGEDSNDKELY